MARGRLRVEEIPTASPDVVRFGRPEPFEVFYRREIGGLVVLCRALCGPALADDVAQEAMLAAYRRWPEVVELDRPGAWVRRISITIATSTRRRRMLEARALLRLGPPRTAFPEIDQPHEAFWAALRRLPRRQAQAAALRYVDDLTAAETAEAMGCSEGAVTEHLTLAQQALAAQAPSWTEDDG